MARERESRIKFRLIPALAAVAFLASCSGNTTGVGDHGTATPPRPSLLVVRDILTRLSSGLACALTDPARESSGPGQSTGSCELPNLRPVEVFAFASGDDRAFVVEGLVTRPGYSGGAVDAFIVSGEAWFVRTVAFEDAVSIQRLLGGCLTLQETGAPVSGFCQEPASSDDSSSSGAAHSPAEAARRLIEAWFAGDEQAARSVATEAAVQQLFSYPPEEGLEEARIICEPRPDVLAEGELACFPDRGSVLGMVVVEESPGLYLVTSADYPL